jgi:SnoaL-like domain
MSDLQAIADRFAIAALRGEFTDASMMRDWGRFASLLTRDGAGRIPDGSVGLAGREKVRAGIGRLPGLRYYFVPAAHAGAIQRDGDTAVGRACIAEPGHLREGSSDRYAAYHDRCQRTPDRWKFTERAYGVRYLGTAGEPGAQRSEDFR